MGGGIKEFFYAGAENLLVVAALYGNMVAALVAQQAGALAVHIGAGDKGYTLEATASSNNSKASKKKPVEENTEPTYVCSFT